MRFDPKSEQEVANVLPNGEYNAEVFEAIEETSTAGNAMIRLSLRVYRNDSPHTWVFVNDYLLPHVESMQFKLRHFCRSAGLLDIYESGNLEDYQCKGRNVRVRLRIEENNQYGNRNRVVDYIGGRDASTMTPQPQTTEEAIEASKPTEDDIPF